MKVFLPFYDDSTLIFAGKMQQLLSNAGVDAITFLSRSTDERLSERQLQQILPNGPDMQGENSIFGTNALSGFDAVITSKAPIEIKRLLEDRKFKANRNRPAFIAFQPGLEFTPDKGRKNRIDFDIVFTNNADHRDSFKRAVRSKNWQRVSFGHPYFLLQEGRDNQGENVYFFAQAISPMTLESRRFVVEMLITIAERFPLKKVFIKLRHLPNENAAHVHREVFSYPWILDRYFPNRPANLLLTACTMDEALKDASHCITCTSTAAMDAISAGIPILIYTDYPENYMDPLVEPMRSEFIGSGLVSIIPEIMHLIAKHPEKKWLETRFRGIDFIEELKRFVAQFRDGGK